MLRHRLRAALLLADPEAVLTGAHACRAHGLRYVPEALLGHPAPPQVLVPESRQVRVSRWVRPVRTRRLPGARWRSGLPIAPVERAVLDTSLVTPSLQDVRALVCEPVQRRLTTAERMAAEAALAPVRGSRLLRIAVADVLAGCRSAPECELRTLVLRSRVLPEPQWNTPLPDLPDISPDGWWKEARLVLEVDSVEHHGLGPRCRPHPTPPGPHRRGRLDGAANRPAAHPAGARPPSARDRSRLPRRAAAPPALVRAAMQRVGP
jgi:hypothetical protein